MIASQPCGVNLRCCIRELSRTATSIVRVKREVSRPHILHPALPAPHSYRTAAGRVAVCGMSKDTAVLQKQSTTEAQESNVAQLDSLRNDSQAATGAVLRRQQQQSAGQNGVNATGQPTASDPSLEAQPGEVWYLAYGSNMNTKVLTGRRKVVPLSSYPCSVDGYCLAFSYRGMPYLEPGFATITPLTTVEQQRAPHAHSQSNGNTSSSSNPASSSQQDGSSTGAESPQQPFDAAPPLTGLRTAAEGHEQLVRAGLHGVIHLVSEGDWERIKATEGVAVKGIGYQVVQVKCNLYGGGWVMADTLMAAPSAIAPPASTLPSKRYMNIIREGAKEFGVDPSYQSVLDAHPAYDRAEHGLPATAAAVVLAGTFGTCALVSLPLVLVLAVVMRFTGPASKSHELQMDATAHAHTQRGVRGGKTRLRAALQPPSTQSSQQPGSTNGESQPRPPPLMARRVLSIRQAFGHPVMAVYFFFVMRFVWVLHDYIAAPLLGSGCDHPKRA